jgi:2-amino-4-hydroxy-6-hydroxymethyldihydropteridine diphosphokinase
MRETPNPHLVVDADTLGSLPSVRAGVLALGSNLGDRFANLQGALHSLADTPHVHLVAVSPVYETTPVGGPADAPDFLNAVVTLDTTLRSAQLLDRLHAIEEAFGRIRAARNDPRTLDLDLITLGSRRVSTDELTLPHPRASQRPFVLQPWLDIDPAADIPGEGAVADLLAKLGTDGLRQRSDLRLDAR